MKAMLYNNIATCLFHMGNLPKAELNNEMALVEEPDYAKALLRKVLILERKGEYSQAVSIADFAIGRFDDDFEDDRNRKLVPDFREVITRLSGKTDIARRVRKQVMKEEVERELGIGGEEETASQSFFSEIGQYTERFKKKHGEVELGEDAVPEVKY